MLTLFSKDFQYFLSLKVWDVCNESTSSPTDGFAIVRVPQMIDLRVSEGKQHAAVCVKDVSGPRDSNSGVANTTALILYLLGEVW